MDTCKIPECNEPKWEDAPYCERHAAEDLKRTQAEARRIMRKL